MQASKTYNMLVVDDDDVIVSIISNFLIEEGFENTSFLSPKEALESVSTLSDIPLVVVSDYDMPHMNGLMFLKAVRELKPSAFGVILTADPGVVKAQDSRAVVFNKSCDRMHLLQLVDSIKQFLSTVG